MLQVGAAESAQDTTEKNAAGQNRRHPDQIELQAVESARGEGQTCSEEARYLLFQIWPAEFNCGRSALLID